MIDTTLQVKADALEKAHNEEGPNIDNRDLEEYEAHVKLLQKFSTIDDLLDSLAADGIPLRWVDYCCGQSAALEQGTSRYSQNGARALESVGIDLRNFPGRTYDEVPTFQQGQVRFFRADIENEVPSGLNPSLATCLYGFTYIRDPLKVISQIYADMTDKGYFLFTLGNRNRVTDFDDPLGIWTARKLDEQGLLVALGNSIIKEFTILLKKDRIKVPNLDFGLILERCSTNPNLWIRNEYTISNDI